MWKTSYEGHGVVHHITAQVKVLAPPVYPAMLTTSHWSPEVKCVQSGANLDESDGATSTHNFSSHTEQGAAELLSNCLMAKQERSVWWTDLMPTAEDIDTRCRRGYLHQSLARSDWCRAGSRSHPEALQDCRPSKLRASCATRDASPAFLSSLCDRARAALCSGRGCCQNTATRSS